MGRPISQIVAAVTAEVVQLAENGPVAWDDPAFWSGVSVDVCSDCAVGHVLRNGKCWNCERAAREPLGGRS